MAAVCRAAGVPAPRHVSYYAGRKARRGGRHARSSARSARPRPPLYEQAPGCRKLRVVRRGNTLLVLAKIALLLLTIGIVAFAGAIPALLLPGWGCWRWCPR